MKLATAKHIITTILLAAGAPLVWGQQTITIPAQTINLPATAQAHQVTFTGGQFYVDGAAIATATFTGPLTASGFTFGNPAVYVNNQRYDLLYLTASGFAPILATPATGTATGGGAASTPAFTAYKVTVPQVAAGVVQVGINAAKLTTAAQVISTTPVLTAAPSTDMSLGHTFAQTSIYNGSIYVSVWNYGKQAMPAQVWTVLIGGK